MRKMIALDLKETQPEYLRGIASVVLAISIGYWLVVKLPSFDLEFGSMKDEQKLDMDRSGENKSTEFPYPTNGGKHEAV